MALEKHECWLESEEIKRDCDVAIAIKSFQDSRGNWHWMAIRIHDLQPIATCCHTIVKQAKPS